MIKGSVLSRNSILKHILRSIINTDEIQKLTGCENSAIIIINSGCWKFPFRPLTQVPMNITLQDRIAGSCYPISSWHRLQLRATYLTVANGVVVSFRWPRIRPWARLVFIVVRTAGVAGNLWAGLEISDLKFAIPVWMKQCMFVSVSQGGWGFVFVFAVHIFLVIVVILIPTIFEGF
jgi:hypothetical protein